MAATLRTPRQTLRTTVAQPQCHGFWWKISSRPHRTDLPPNGGLAREIPGYFRKIEVGEILFQLAMLGVWMPKNFSGNSYKNRPNKTSRCVLPCSSTLLWIQRTGIFFDWFCCHGNLCEEKSGTRVSGWKLVTIVSKLVYNLFRGLTTYIYRGYNPFTKYHGHPST